MRKMNRQMRSLGASKGKFRSDEINVRETDETKLLSLRSESLEENLEGRIEGDSHPRYIRHSVRGVIKWDDLTWHVRNQPLFTSLATWTR